MSFERTVFAVLIALLTACSGGPTAVTLEDQTLTVACGLCQFRIDGARGCFWAAEVEGTHYPVVGSAIPADHDAHAPDGMCLMPRKAVVSGTVHSGRLTVTRFDLAPATDVPKNATVHEHDHDH